jgi:uncharacterized protein YjbI with pentapeptide repeats
LKIFYPFILGISHNIYLKQNDYQLVAVASLAFELDKPKNIIPELKLQQILQESYPDFYIDECWPKINSEIIIYSENVSSIKISNINYQEKAKKFSPINTSNKKHRKFYGKLNNKYLENIFPHLPEDLNPEYFQISPKKLQQLNGFNPGEEFQIQMEDDSHIQSNLPSYRIISFTKKLIEGKLDTCIFLPKNNIGIANYRFIIPVNDYSGKDIKHILFAIEVEKKHANHYKKSLKNRLGEKREFFSLKQNDLLPNELAIKNDLVENNENIFPTSKFKDEAEHGPQASIYKQNFSSKKITNEISNTKFNYCNFIDSQFNQSTLDNVTFDNCQMQRASFIDTSLQKVKFINCKLNFAIFDKSILMHNEINNCELNFTNFITCSFFKSEINKCIFYGSNFDESTLNNCFSSIFKYAKLKKSGFSNHSLNNIIFEKCQFDYSGFDGQKSNLNQCEFINNQINCCNFIHSKVYRCQLSYNQLNNSQFKNTEWQECNINNNSFDDTDFNDAKIIETTMQNNHINNSNLIGLIIENQLIQQQNLQNCLYYPNLRISQNA